MCNKYPKLKKTYISGKLVHVWQIETKDESNTSWHAISIQQPQHAYVTLTWKHRHADK